MNTAIALIVLVGLAYGTFLLLTLIWGRYEIDPEEYQHLAWIFKEYPDLGSKLKTFRHNGRITKAEMRDIEAERKRRVRETHTAETLEERRTLIMRYIED